jgi:hypothetical protein
MGNRSDEQTDDPAYADEQILQGRDMARHDELAGSSLDRAREVFEAEVKRRPNIRLTIRQRSQVLRKWPDENVHWPDRW